MDDEEKKINNSKKRDRIKNHHQQASQSLRYSQSDIRTVMVNQNDSFPSLSKDLSVKQFKFNYH